MVPSCNSILALFPILPLRQAPFNYFRVNSVNKKPPHSAVVFCSSDALCVLASASFRGSRHVLGAWSLFAVNDIERKTVTHFELFVRHAAQIFGMEEKMLFFRNPTPSLSIQAYGYYHVS